MNEFPTFEDPQEKRSQKVSREVFDQMARQKFAYALSKSSSPEACIQSILNDNSDAIQQTGYGEAIVAALKECERLMDKVQFAQGVFEALKPVLDMQYAAVDKIPAEGSEQRVIVNECLNYDIQGDSLRIHIFTGGIGSITRYMEGLHEVAEDLVGHPEVATVDAISWIVVKHPDILEKKLGFTVQRESDGKPTAQVFGDEEIGYASMDREDFLKKYLKQ